MEFRGDCFDDTYHDVLQAGPFGVVVQYELAVRFRTPERGRSHSRVQRAQVVVQGVQVLEEIPRRRTEHLENLVVAGVLAELEERLAEQLEDVAGGNVCRGIPWIKNCYQIQSLQL